MEPVNEGPIPNDPFRVRLFDSREAYLNINCLEKGSFDYLGEWRVGMNPEGNGIAYRMGVREGVVDDEGDRATLIMHFACPLLSKGVKMDMEELQRKFEESMRQMMEISTIQIYQKTRHNVMSVKPDIPPWMMQDLEELLK